MVVRNGFCALLFTAGGEKRGLGPLSQVILKETRAKAAATRSIAQCGLDPRKERERKTRNAARYIHLLRDITEDAYESGKADFKGDGKAGR